MGLRFISLDGAGRELVDRLVEAGVGAPEVPTAPGYAAAAVEFEHGSVRVRLSAATAVYFTYNPLLHIGVGGCFLPADSDVPLGTGYQVDILDPRDQLLVRCRAKVAAKQDRWVGLRFHRRRPRHPAASARRNRQAFDHQHALNVQRCWSSSPHAVFGLVASRSRRARRAPSPSRWRRAGARGQAGAGVDPRVGRRRAEARTAGQRGRGGSRRGGDGGARSRQAGRQPGSGGADRQRGGRARVAGARPAGARPAAARARRGGFPATRPAARGARDAFTLFSDVVIGASALIVLGGPRRARRGAVVARGRLTDPRVRRLARQSGAVAILPSPAKSHDLLAAAAAAGVPGLELSASALPDADAVSDALAQAARATMAAVGVLGKASERLPAPAADAEVGEGPVVAIRPVRVRADSDGFLETDVVPGTVTRARAALGRVVPALPGPPSPVLASIDGLVIEASPPGAGARRGDAVHVAAAGGEGRAAARARQQGAGGEPAAAASDGEDARRLGRIRRVPAAGRGSAEGQDRHRRAHQRPARRAHADRRHRGRSTPAAHPGDHRAGRRPRASGRTACARRYTGSRWCATRRGARSGGR